MFQPGTVIHWRDFISLAKSKYILILGSQNDGTTLAFTISTQSHWLGSKTHSDAMIEIPAGATKFLPAQSFIMCFFKPLRFSKVELEQALADEEIIRSGCLGLKYLHKVRVAIGNDLLEEKDISDIAALLEQVLVSADH